MNRITKHHYNFSLEVNNNAISQRDRMALALRNFKQVSDQVFIQLTKTHAYYEQYKPAELTSYSYTAMHTWIKRQAGSLDMDFFIWWSKELGLPDLALLGYTTTDDQAIITKHAQPVRDSIYLDGSQAQYLCEPCAKFDTTGWYVVEHDGERKVLKINKTPAGIKATNNIDDFNFTDLSELTFKEKITHFIV